MHVTKNLENATVQIFYLVMPRIHNILFLSFIKQNCSCPVDLSVKAYLHFVDVFLLL